MSAHTSLVIVSGMSGAGRSTAMKALEDLGFYCVDNLPIVLVEAFVDLFASSPQRLAVVIDVRERQFLEEFPALHARLRKRELAFDLLFLDASDEVLAKRFDETRRVHPAAKGGPLRVGIQNERDLLGAVSVRADATVDTSQMSVHALRRAVMRRYTGKTRSGGLEVHVCSFGFRYGTPEVADLMMDVRFLPNPNERPELRERTGLDREVAAFVLERPGTMAFLERFFDFLDFLLPLYVEEGKAYLGIAIGCTGGQHRSVAIANALERYLQERKIDVSVTHRDVVRTHEGRALGQQCVVRPSASEDDFDRRPSESGSGPRIASLAGAARDPGEGALEEGEQEGEE